MKTVYIGTTIILAILMLFLPLISITSPKVASVGVDLPDLKEENIEPLNKTSDAIETVRVYITDEEKVETISTADYIFGVVAAEMPALYENEALKAQAVAAYTYMAYKVENGGKKDYDITDNYRTDQAFISREKAREKWGENADEYETKIRNAVNSVLYQKLTFEGKTVLSAYHAISYGFTEDAKVVWGDGYPYLCSVESAGDKLSPNYLSKVEFTAAELESKMKDLVTFSGDKAKYFGKAEKTDAGTVKTISVCGKNLSGSDIRKALELRSSNFTVNFENEKFVFTVLGYGHGLGMSQYGAHYMALQGKTYKEILLHYYTGCELK